MHMKKRHIKSFLTHGGPFLLGVLLIPTFGPAQQKKKTMTGSAARGPATASLEVTAGLSERPGRFLRVQMPVPTADLSQRLARFRRVQMQFQTATLSTREQQLVRKLVEACGYLESIYWRQTDPEGLTLYQSLASARNPRDVQLRRYLWINASRFDLLDQNRAFVGTEGMSPGRGFYPANLMRAPRARYVKEHPDQKAAIYDQFTIA